MHIIVDQLAVRYTDEGTGPVVVLLHGWGSNLETFQALSATLTSHFRVLRFDFPGFGQTPRPAQDWGMTEYAEFLKHFLTKVKAEHPFAFIGHSFGGRAILKAVGSGLVQPNKIILLASAGVKKSQSVRNTTYAAAAKVGKAITALPGLSKLRQTLRKKLYTVAGSEDYLQAGQMKSTFLKVINEDLQADASKITLPTLLIWGDQDDATPLQDGQALHNQMKNSRLEVIPQAGHYVYVDAAEQVTRLIQEFLV